MKTASLGYQNTTNQPLGPDEQAAIVDVIQRAEQLDLTEQERVRIHRFIIKSCYFWIQNRWAV